MIRAIQNEQPAPYFYNGPFENVWLSACVCRYGHFFLFLFLKLIYKYNSAFNKIYNHTLITSSIVNRAKLLKKRSTEGN